MREKINDVQVIYNNAIKRQQYKGKPIFIVMTGTEHAAIYERAKTDIEKIAQAAGVKVLKTAHIAVRRGMRRQQEAGLKEINEMLRKIRETSNKEEAMKWGIVAAGYANGMCCGDLMSKSELYEVIQVIDQIYKTTESRIEDVSRPFWLRIIRKWVRAWACRNAAELYQR